MLIVDISIVFLLLFICDNFKHLYINKMTFVIYCESLKLQYLAISLCNFHKYLPIVRKLEKNSTYFYNFCYNRFYHFKNG
ncbi:hypothetical protein CD113_07615 [Staphylococcus simiae]|nr:hypothetical protein CD113_07615 [Staphylococcus simiae]